jgi:hypothetical protein
MKPFILCICLLLAACARGGDQPAAQTLTAPVRSTPVVAPTTAPSSTAPRPVLPSLSQTATAMATGIAPSSPAASRTAPSLPSPIPSETATPLAPLPTSTAVPTAPATTQGGPIIHFFRAEPEEAAPGDKIVLQWQSDGATEAVLYHILPSGQMPASGWHVAPSGTYTYTVEPGEKNWSDFLLYVLDASERSTGANLRVKLHCTTPWFFSPVPGVCPAAPIVSAAAEQHFEHGTMVWIKEPWSPWVNGEGWIIVLYDDVNDWSIHGDQWKEGQPDHDTELSPPPGLYLPIRGFGLLWRQNPEMRNRLGWAADQEAGFQTTIQHTTRFKYNSIYLSALDGNVWHLGPEFSSWAKIVVDQE